MKYEVRWEDKLPPLTSIDIHLGFSDESSGGAVAEMARQSPIYRTGYLVIIDLQAEEDRKAELHKRIDDLF